MSPWSWYLQAFFWHLSKLPALGGAATLSQCQWLGMVSIPGVQCPVAPVTPPLAGDPGAARLSGGWQVGAAEDPTVC